MAIHEFNPEELHNTIADAVGEPRLQPLPTILANDCKKDQRFIQRNGWIGEFMNNKKGIIRTCRIYGDYTEIGDIYVWDIYALIDVDNQPTHRVVLSPAQEKRRVTIEKALNEW